MKKGNQLGEYSFKSTSNRVREDGDLEINLEGTVSGGFGFVVGTMTVTVGMVRAASTTCARCHTATTAA